MERHELVALSEVSLFKELDILELESFFGGKGLKSRHFDKDEIIARQGDSYDSLIIILDGSAAALMAAPGGKQVRIETLQGPCAAASAVLFSGEANLPVTLQAQGGLSCVSIPRRWVLELMQNSASFLESYLRENGDKLLFLSEKIRLFQFKSLKQKIVGHLMMLMRRQGGGREIRLMYNKEEMAQLMGVARPSLSREFSSLVHGGLIESSGKKVKILNPDGLKAVLEEE